MGKYFIKIIGEATDDRLVESFDSLTINLEQYTAFLNLFSADNLLNEILNNQSFRCGKCRSFCLPAKSFFLSLQKINNDDDIVESISTALRERTGIEAWYLDILDKPRETLEKIFDDTDEFEEFIQIKDSLAAGSFVVDDGELYEFPFEECAFIFDVTCSSCRDFLRAI